MGDGIFGQTVTYLPEVKKKKKKSMSTGMQSLSRLLTLSGFSYVANENTTRTRFTLETLWCTKVHISTMFLDLLNSCVFLVFKCVLKGLCPVPHCYTYTNHIKRLMDVVQLKLASVSLAINQIR